MPSSFDKFHGPRDECRINDHRWLRSHLHAPKRVFPFLLLASLLTAGCDACGVEPDNESDTSPASTSDATTTGTTAGPEPTTFGPETSESPTTDPTTTTGDPTSTTAPPNIPPQIEFFRLLNNGVPLELPTTIHAPVELTIDVVASDFDGEVTEIKIEVDSETLINTMPDGGHLAVPWLIATSDQNSDEITLRAIAHDDEGQASELEEIVLAIDLHNGTEVWEYLSPDPGDTEFRAVGFTSEGEVIAVGRRFAQGSELSRLYVDVLAPSDGSSTVESINLAQPPGAIEGHDVVLDPTTGDLFVVGRRVFEGKFHPFLRRLTYETNNLNTVDEYIFEEAGAALAIATDSNGTVYVTGYEGTLDTNSRAFVAKFVDMSSQWYKPIYLENAINQAAKRGAGFDILYASHDDHIYVGGVHTELNPANEGMLALRLTPSGALAGHWVSPFAPNLQRQEARAIAITPEGQLYAGGLLRKNNEYATSLLRLFSIENNEIKEVWSSTYPLPTEAGALDRVIYGMTNSPEVFPNHFDLALAATIHQSDDMDQIEPMRSAWVSDFDFDEIWWSWSWDRPETQAFDIGWGPDGFHYTVGFHDGDTRRAWVRKTIP